MADNKLKELGFELKCNDSTCGYWTYENVNDDQRVDITYDGEDWFINSETISTERDWFGNEQSRPIGLKYEEVKAFMELIDELKGEN